MYETNKVDYGDAQRSGNETEAAEETWPVHSPPVVAFQLSTPASGFGALSFLRASLVNSR